MYEDLTRALIPARALRGLADQGRRVLDSNKRVLDWQLDQARSFEKQTASLASLTLDAVTAQGKAVIDAWSDALDALAPVDKAA